MALCFSLLLVLLPNPLQPELVCYSFAPGGPVCADCGAVNHCASCSDGNCQAYDASECNPKMVSVPAPAGGYTARYVPVNCFSKKRCVKPDPCSGPCSLEDNPYAHSEETGLSAEPFQSCKLR